MNNIIDDLETQFEPSTLGPQTFADMRAMPVVVMMRERQDFYVNVSHPDFGATVFVAMKHTTKSEDGTMTAEFEEFVPCNEV